MSNLNQVIKMSSNEGGPISTALNRLSFTLPNNSGAYDLSKSYINLNCSIDSDQIGVQIPQVSINNDVGANDDAKAFNIAIVRHANVTCAKGSIASIRRVDLLKNTLNNYTLTTDQQASLDYSSLFQSYGQNQAMGSIFRNIYKEGSVLSSNKNGVVKIPLNQICNFGNVTNYDTSKFGRTDINLELNLDKISVSNFLGVEANNNWDTNEKNECKDLTATFGPDTNQLATTRNFKSLEDSPYWVGQRIDVGYSDRTATVQNKVRTITAIEFMITEAGADNGQVTLTLDSPLEATPLTGAEEFTLISCGGIDANFDFVLSDGEIVLEKLSNVTSPQDITYTEFVSEIYTTAPQSNFQKQFFIEPSCMNLYVMMGGSYISKKGDLSEWRFRLNNEDLTNRNVKYHSPLSLDRLNMCFNNSSLKLSNTNEIFSESPINQVGPDSFPDSFDDGNKLLLACNPLPITESQKMVQVSLTSTSADIVEIVLYKELATVISS